MSRAVPACPHCARPDEQPLVCDRCGWRWYANPKPAAAVLLERQADGAMEPSVLLLRRAVEPGLGAWDLPAGYLDPGESFEIAARRETREEAGIDVELIALAGVYHSAPGQRGDRCLPRAIAFEPMPTVRDRLRVERPRLGRALGGDRLAAANGVRRPWPRPSRTGLPAAGGPIGGARSRYTRARPTLDRRPMPDSPVRVAVTGAAGQIGYALLFRLASGAAFGPGHAGRAPAPRAGGSAAGPRRRANGARGLRLSSAREHRLHLRHR